MVGRERSLGFRVLGDNVLVVGRGYNIREPSTSKPKFPTNLQEDKVCRLQAVSGLTLQLAGFLMSD